MARPTDWRKLAVGGEWFSDTFDHQGPAAYELGTRSPHGRSIRPCYVGETVNERQRMARYGYDGSHLSSQIDAELQRGATLYYRAWALPSKGAAVRRQNNLLDRWEYDWNTQRNR